MTVKVTQLGRFYEDFEIGDVYRHPLGRTVTDTDNVWFTLLTQNTNPTHFDHKYAAQSEFRKPLVNSAFTIALVLGQTVVDTSQHAFANLGMDELRLTHPVYVGDTLYAESQVLAKRESASRPHGGIVTIKSRGLNQHGVTVVHWKRSFFVYKRGADGARSPFPEPDRPIEDI